MTAADAAAAICLGTSSADLLLRAAARDERLFRQERTVVASFSVCGQTRDRVCSDEGSCLPIQRPSLWLIHENAFVPGWELFAARSNSAAMPTTLFELTQQPTICGSLRASFETKEREELQRKSITKWSKW